MTVKTGRYIVRRNGVEVDASGEWKVGPAISSADIAGVDGSVTWHRTEPVSVMETDHTDADYRGDEVTIHWVDEDGEALVFTGTVDSTSGESLAEPTSRLTDGTARLTRSLDLRPMAWTLPVHPVNADAGGRERHVGLFGIWFTHQAMVHAGFDPGVPMHWSSVWYQSMCGSVATVPDKDHAYASLGDLRSAHRLSDADAAPQFVPGENQHVAQDVFAFGVTTPPKGDTGNLPWQLTFDLPIDGGDDGEIVLRNLDTAAGLAVKWSTSDLSVYRHNASGTQDLLGTVERDRNLATGDKRWTIVAAPSGTSVIVRTDARGQVAHWQGAGTIHPLPTGPNGLCTVRESIPGRIGAVAVSRGDRQYMTTEPPKGRILRTSLNATSLPGWPNMPDVQAGRVLADQADAHRGLRAQPIWSWIDHEGLLVNADFDTLAARPVVMEFDTRPDSGDLALDSLAWETTPPGGPYSSVEVKALRQSVALRSRPSLLLAEGSAQGLQHGDDYEVFLHPESGTTWLEPDLRPLMAGYPYPSPPYDPRYKNYLNGEIKTWLGGHRFFADSGERRGWLLPYQMSWTVDALGHVQGAIEQLDPATVLVTGKAVLPQGRWPQDASTSPDPGSEGLGARRKDQPFPQLRGYGLMREVEASVTLPVDGVDDRHPPYSHDCGSWIQSTTGLSRIGDYLHESITRPTPRRTAKVEQTGRVRAGDKVLLRERRRNGIVIEEEVVLGSIAGATHTSDDAMTIEGIVVTRRVVQTDPGAPPVDQEEEWVTPPPVVPPAPPRDTTPPRREDDPPHNPDDPPGSGPVKPSTPELSYDSHGLLVLTWDGQNAAGGSAVTAYFGAAEVALAKVATPDEVVGSMRAEPDGTFLFSEPSVDYGSQWWARIRVTDRWGRVSPWSDVTGPVEVVPLVDPGQFEDLRDRLEEAEIEIAETGAELGQRIDQAETDLAAANDRLSDAEADLIAAFGGLEALAASGSNLVPDGDMEAGMAAPTGTASIITGNAYSGTKHARLPATSYTSVIFPWVQATPGMVLRAGFAAKRNGSATSGTIRFGIEVERADGSVVTSYTGTSATPATLTDTWQAFTQPTKVTLPANAVRWRARPYQDGTASGAGTFDIDLVTVYDATNASALEAAQDRLAIAEHQINTVFPTRFGNIDDAITIIQDDVSAIETATGQKIVTSPTPPDPATTDIWIDTSATPAVPKFYDGTTWEPLTNPDAIADALAAAKEHANNLPKVLHGTGPATGNAPDGSVWFQHEGTIRGRVTGQWLRDGGTWVETPIDSQAIANLDVGKLTAGSASISDLVAERIAAATGQFLSLDVGQLVVEDGAISNLVAEHFAARTSSLIEADIGNLVVTGTSTMSEAVIDSLWTNVVRSRKITTDMLLVGSGVNLITDPTFADAGLNAHRSSTSTGTWVAGGDTTGFRAAASTMQSALHLDASPESRFVPVNPGETMRIRYRAVTHSLGNSQTRAAVRYVRTDGTEVYEAAGAYQPAGKGVGNWTTHVFSWVVPEDATHARLSLQVAPGASHYTDFINPSFSIDGASLIVTGSIDAEKLNVQDVAAKVGEFISIKANQIEAGTLSAAVTMTGSLTLSSTNGKIRTAASGARAEMDRDGFHLYDSFNRSLFEATADGVEMVGDFRTGISNLMGVHIFPTTSTYGQGTIEFRHSSLTSSTYPSLYLNTEPAFGTHLAMRGPHNADPGIRLGEMQTSINGRSSVGIWAGNGGMVLASDGGISLDGPVSIGLPGLQRNVTSLWTDPRDEHRFYSTSSMRVGAGAATWDSSIPSNELLLEPGGRTFLTGVPSDATTTQDPNTHIALNGRVRRATSLTAAKVAIAPLGDEWKAVKGLEPVTWIDREDAERYAAAIESGDDDLADIGYLAPQVGFLAEQAEEVGAPGVPTYDNDGSLSGVAYSRVAALQQKWLHELEDRINQLEGKSEHR